MAGPFIAETYTKGPPIPGGFRPDWRWKRRWWFRQPPPYVSPLEWEVYVKEVASFSASNPLYYADIAECPSYDGGQYARASNKVLEKFNNLIGDTSTWGANLGELGKTVDMVGNRARQILRFAKHLSRGNLPAAYSELKKSVDFKDPSTRKNFPKDFGKRFLEYHFGWEPLVGDIHNGIQALANYGKTETRRIRARGSVRDHSFHKVSSGDSYSLFTTDVVSRYNLSARVRIENPNLFLLNSLGLVNPAAIAWELVPFSFVVDWFLPVGQFLSSFTASMGLEITLASSTGVQVVTQQVNNFYGDFPFTGNYQTRNALLRSVYVKRNLGIPGVIFKAKQLKAPSTIRAATQVSLLTQFLRTR